MIYPPRHDLVLLRGQPFRYFIDIVGLDLTGGDFRMQFRHFPDQPGPPLIDLMTGDFPTEGIFLTGVETVDGVPTSTLRVIIGQDTIEALPAAPIGEDTIELVYDLVIAAGDLRPSRFLEGKGIVKGGATKWST